MFDGKKETSGDERKEKYKIHSTAADIEGVGMFDLSAACHVLKQSTAILGLKKIISVTVRSSMAPLCIFKAHPTHAVRVFRTLFLLYKIALIFSFLKKCVMLLI